MKTISSSIVSRPFRRLSAVELHTPYALNVLQGIANVETDKGTARYVVCSIGNYYGVKRHNQPLARELQFPVRAFDCAARVALSTLAAF